MQKKIGIEQILHWFRDYVAKFTKYIEKF
jgi:hypothetical protein